MKDGVRDFYDGLAERYHLIFGDWDRAIERQAAVLGPLLAAETAAGPLKVLDCACGIGTQAIGFATMGHHVAGSDLSPEAIARATREARSRGMEIAFHVADMTTLAGLPEGFDVIVALDNALPHLSLAELAMAARAIASRLKPGGVFLASIRDYDSLMRERPTIQPPMFYGTEGSRTIVHQVWDWIDEREYRVHLYITSQAGGGWDAGHFTSAYYALRRAELSTVLNDAGFAGTRWLMPADSGFYQPLVVARLPAT